jgi:poly-gamma-glutamate synthesis protein (capsule biosynthesis protein)
VENLITLTELNVQFASLANNHALDFGRSGYENTVHNLDMIGIKAFGHPTVFSAESAVYVQSGDYVIALVGIHTLFGVPDEAQVERVLAAIKARSDIQIAYVHWGPEYRLTHAPPQAQFAATLVEHGVDAIIGHHPHVTQDVQLVGDVPVFYSLGNFIFDQYFSADVQAGYLLGLVVQADTLEFTFYPHDSRLGLSQTSLTNEPARTLFLQKLAKRSDQLLAPDIASGTIKIPWKN